MYERSKGCLKNFSILKLCLIKSLTGLVWIASLGCKFAISRPVRQNLLRQVQQSSLHQVKQSLLHQVQKKIAYFIHPSLMECETPLICTLYQSSFLGEELTSTFDFFRSTVRPSVSTFCPKFLSQVLFSHWNYPFKGHWTLEIIEAFLEDDERM